MWRCDPRFCEIWRYCGHEISWHILELRAYFSVYSAGVSPSCATGFNLQQVAGQLNRKRHRIFCVRRRLSTALGILMSLRLCCAPDHDLNSGASRGDRKSGTRFGASAICGAKNESGLGNFFPDVRFAPGKFNGFGINATAERRLRCFR